jgi:purine/pyrimidine-nucleoside phosphorylase
VMEGVGGSCRVRLAGQSEWSAYREGQSFDVPGNSSFEIAVAEGDAYHYVCHFG